MNINALVDSLFSTCFQTYFASLQLVTWYFHYQKHPHWATKRCQITLNWTLAERMRAEDNRREIMVFWYLSSEYNNVCTSKVCLNGQQQQKKEIRRRMNIFSPRRAVWRWIIIAEDRPQNYRIVRVGYDVWRSSSPSPAAKVHLEQVTQEFPDRETPLTPWTSLPPLMQRSSSSISNIGLQN